MTVTFTQEFIDEVGCLMRSKSHSQCENDLILTIFKSTNEEIISQGSPKRLNKNSENPFVRRRMDSNGSGKSAGYRLYLWFLRTEDSINIVFIHPKTGRRSASNITRDKQKELAKDFLKARNDGSLIKVTLNKEENKIITLNQKTGKYSNVF